MITASSLANRAIRNVLNKRETALFTHYTPIDFLQSCFYVYDTETLLELYPCQIAPLQEALRRDNAGRYVYDTVLWSWMKKSAKCLHPDTLLLQPDGNWKAAIDIVAGDEVIGWSDGLTVSTVQAMEIQREQRMYEVTTSRGRKIVTTANHPFLVWSKQYPSRMNPSQRTTLYWRNADELSIGDRLTVALDYATDKDCDWHNYYLLGAYVGDGGQGRITTADVEIRDAFAERFEIKPIARYSYQLMKSKDWLREYGLLDGTSANWKNYSNSYTKHVPYQLFAAGKSAICAFLSGYLDTDGFVSNLTRKQPSLGWGSVNYGLLEECQRLLAAIGINATLFQHDSKLNGKRFEAYKLMVYGKEQIVSLAKMLKPKVPHKRDRLSAWSDKSVEGARANTYKTDRVIGIRELLKSISVAIQVANVETHITNGIVTHNSTVVAGIADYVACTKPKARIRLIANDRKQADSRVGYYMRQNIMIGARLGYGDSDTGKRIQEFRQNTKITPSGYTIEYPNGSIVECVPIDPTGEAGGNDDLLIFSELWGWQHKAHQDMWAECTISPNRFGYAQRWIDTYAGYEGDSPILEHLYQQVVKDENRLDIPDNPECYASGKTFATWVTKHHFHWQTPEYYCLPLPENKNDLLALTSTGWKSAIDITLSDELCTMDSNGFIEYQQPTDIFNSDYVGDLIRLKHTKADMVMTPNHRVFAAYASHTRKVKNVLSKPFEYVYKNAIDAMKMPIGWIPGHGQISNQDLSTFTIGSRIYNADAFIEFMAWYLAEGCLTPDKKKGVIYYSRIAISQDPIKNPEKYRLIIDVCRRLGYEPKLSRVGIAIYDAKLARYLLQFGKSHEKSIPRWILDKCSKRQLRIFLDAYIKGDGSSRQNEESWLVYTNSNQMNLDIMELAFKAGYRPRYIGSWSSAINRLPIHHISIMQSHIGWSQGNKRNHWFVEKATPNTRVWCPTLPNGNFYVMQNGTCFWTGNSSERIQQTEEQFQRMHLNQWVLSENAFVPIDWWDNAANDDIPLISPYDEIVIALDAAVSGDCFAIVAVSRDRRYPSKFGSDGYEAPDRLIKRYARAWTPPKDGKLQFWSDNPDDITPTSELKRLIKTYNVVQVTYDPYQLEHFISQLAHESDAWFDEFNQQGEREIADKMLYDAIREGRIAHNGQDDMLREHIKHSNGKLIGDERKLRIVKRSDDKKVDLCVALSMAAKRAVDHIAK